MSPRANRIMWSIVGVVRAAAGIVGILLSLGTLPGTDRHGTLLTEGLHATWRSWGGWAPALLIVAGVVVMAIGAVLLRAELHRRRGHTIGGFLFAHPLGEPGPDGHPVRGEVQVASRTLRNALQADLRNNPSIKHASVTITGEAARPQLYLKIESPPPPTCRPFTPTSQQPSTDSA